MRVRLSTIVIMGAAIVAGAALMATSQRVQEADRELRQLQAARDDARDRLHMMNAQWAYLTRPDRLELLAAQYLPALAPMNPAQLREDFNFPTPVIEEVPTGPTLMPQQATATVPLNAPNKTPEVIADEAVSAPVSADDAAYVPSSSLSSPSQKVAHPAAAVSAPTAAQADTAAALAPAAGPANSGADFSQLINRVTAHAPGALPDDVAKGTDSR